MLHPKTKLLKTKEEPKPKVNHYTLSVENRFNEILIYITF